MKPPESVNLSDAVIKPGSVGYVQGFVPNISEMEISGVLFGK